MAELHNPNDESCANGVHRQSEMNDLGTIGGHGMGGVDAPAYY